MTANSPSPTTTTTTAKILTTANSPSAPATPARSSLAAAASSAADSADALALVPAAVHAAVHAPAPAKITTAKIMTANSPSAAAPPARSSPAAAASSASSTAESAAAPAPGPAKTPTPTKTKMADEKTIAEAATVDSPRRSGRSRVSTTMQIQGHTVLRKNNYKVNGITYVFDEYQEDDPLTKPTKKKLKTTSSSSLGHEQEFKPRESLAQAEIKKHNRFVEEGIKCKRELRRSFLAERLDLLRPFLEPEVESHLQTFLETMQRRPKEEETNNTATAARVPLTQPKMIQAILRPYQLEGLEFMVKMHELNLAMILGDEMGLGKTLQTISLLCHLKETEKITGPSLIVCPLSVLSSWCNEMSKWAPSLKFIQLHASNKMEQLRQRKQLLNHATEYDVILTTYEMAKSPTLLYFFQRTRFHYLVLDEGHKIKSHVTQISIAMRKIHSGNRLLLTGTPLQNNLVELWSLMNFLYPEIFTTSEPFEAHFDLKENIIDKVFLGKTQKLLELFMLRRFKHEVEKLIPDKLETKVYCPLSKVQTFWYKALLLKDVNRLANLESSTEGTEGIVVNRANSLLLRSIFMQLRKCSSHPFLFDGSEINPDETSLEDLIGASGKLSVLDMLLRSLFQKGHRTVLFSQFTMILDLIQDYCILRGWKYCRLDGSTSRARRNYLVNRWNEPNSERFLFLMSTRSGGMGLNLQTADTCILFDSDWNPQSDIQAMARVHRIGQKKTVHVYRLVTAGTVEERMIQRAEKKLLLEMVNRDSHLNTTMDPQQQDSDAVARGFSASELWEDIKFGCEAVFGNSSNNELPSEEDIAVITNRTRKESDSVGKLTGGTSLNAKSFDTSVELTSSQLFRGVDFLELRKKQQQEQNRNIPSNLKGITYLWNDIKALENKKRVRKSRICQIEGKGSGYGLSHVPVLAANNYTFGGETSVFDRELKGSKKSNFEVKKRKKGPTFEHTDYCIICGDGGSLLCCTICPNTVHVSCVGLTDSKGFLTCPHHRCSVCAKNRNDAGGLLFLCHACPLSFCEECLPKEGITFLDKVERFEKLGFDSTKRNVYINCSDTCERYAIQEYGYRPLNPNHKNKLASCPEAIDLSGHFGGSYDLNEAAAAVDTEKEASSGRGKRRVARKNYSLAPRKKSDILTANPAKPACTGATSDPNHSVTTPLQHPKLQLTQKPKSKDTPSTSATSTTDASSDVSDYCVEVDFISPIPASSGNDADHAIQID